MNKTNQIINQKVTDKLVELIRSFSTNEFVEEVGDKIFEETGENIETEDLKLIIGKQLTPIMVNLSRVVLVEE